MSWLLPFFRGRIWRWFVRLCYSTYRTRAHTDTEWQIYRDGLFRIQADILHLVSDIAYTSKCLWVFMGMSHVCSSEVPSPHTCTLVHSLTFYSHSKRVSPRGLPFKSDPFLATVNHFIGHHSLSSSSRAAATVTRKRTSSRCCENMEADRSKDKHPLGPQGLSSEWPWCVQHAVRL